MDRLGPKLPQNQLILRIKKRRILQQTWLQKIGNYLRLVRSLKSDINMLIDKIFDNIVSVSSFLFCLDHHIRKNERFYQIAVDNMLPF